MKLQIILLSISLILIGCDNNSTSNKNKVVAAKVQLKDFEKGYDITENKYMEMLKNYIQNGGDVNGVITNRGDKYTLLLDAVEDGKYIAAKYLLENGADRSVDQRDAMGQTALWLTENPKIARLLLQYGANPYVKNPDGLTLYEKTSRYQPKVARVIKEFIDNSTLNNSEKNKFRVGDAIYVIFKNGKQCNATVIMEGSKQSKIEYNEWCDLGFASSKSKNEKEWAPNSALSTR